MRQRRLTPDWIEAEIARLGDLPRPELLSTWRATFGTKAPERFGRDLLIRGIAQRLQERCFGSLDRRTARMLERIGRAGATALDDTDNSRLKPGTLLVREWQGTLQRVMALDQGFAWNGSTYASLSEVARAITGTNWNGPRFFGLRESRRARSRESRGAAR